MNRSDDKSYKIQYDRLKGGSFCKQTHHFAVKESLKTFEINIEILHIELQACLQASRGLVSL